MMSIVIPLTRLLLALLLLPSLAFAGAYTDMVTGIGGVTHYYRFGEPSGTSANDFCNANAACGGGSGCTSSCAAGTYNGGFTLAQPGAINGDADTAVTLNGSTGYVQVPASVIASNEPRPMTALNFSFATWIKPTAAGDVLSMSDGVAVGTYRVIYTGGNKILFRIYDNSPLCGQGGVYGDALSANTFSTGAWHLVVIATSQNGSAVTDQYVIVNGAEEAHTTSFAGTMCATTYNVYIGQWPLPTITHFNGLIDEPTFFGNKRVTTAESLALYNCGVSGDCGALPITGRRMYQSRAPKIPRYRDDDYFQRVAEGGYVDGRRLLAQGVLPVGVWSPMPPGNIGRLRRKPVL